MIDSKIGAPRRAGVCALAAAVLLAGCGTTGSPVTAVMGSGTGVTATDASRLTRSGFLTEYDRLKTVGGGGGYQCWRAPDVDLRKYDKVLVSRIVVSLKTEPGKQQTVDPSDLKSLTDYFHDSLVRALKPQMAVVGQPGPGVLVIRIALTDLVPTGVAESLAGTLVPYGFVAEAGSGVATGRPAGSTPYMGETGVEIQFRDGASAAVLGECRDTEIGRKYASDLDSGAAGATKTWISGYLNSFESWSYARDAFDKWSVLMAKRLGELRGADLPK